MSPEQKAEFIMNAGVFWTFVALLFCMIYPLMDYKLDPAIVLGICLPPIFYNGIIAFNIILDWFD